MTSKFFSVLESYEKEQEEKMLPSPAECRLASKYGPQLFVILSESLGTC